MTVAAPGSGSTTKRRWFHRKPKPEQIDYVAAMNEARLVKLDFDRAAGRAREAARTGNSAAVDRYMAQAEAAEDRLAEIARYITRTP